VELFYFGRKSRRLYGALHQEKHSAADVGMVLCPPFGEEMAMTYARLAAWSKRLALHRIAVLRFHPYGTGESEGSFADFTLSSAVSDTVTAAGWARGKLRVPHLGLLGLRFGASLAVRAAQSEEVDFLVLWSPILNLQQYFRDLLRLRILKEMIHQQQSRVRLTSQGMIQQFEMGACVDLFGYELSPELYREMIAATEWPQHAPAGKILWLAQPAEAPAALPIVERWRAQGSVVDLQMLKTPAFWEDFSSFFPEQYTNATQQWLAGLVKAS
jgi:exosortase A-associated hydrolase 2